MAGESVRPAADIRACTITEAPLALDQLATMALHVSPSTTRSCARYGATPSDLVYMGGIVSHRLRLVSALLVAVPLSIAWTPPGASAATPVVTLAGQLPGSSAGGATVVVLVESPLGTLDNPVPDTLTWTPVAYGTADASGNYSVPVPDGAAVDAAEAGNNGHANFFVTAVSGSAATIAGVPVNLSDTASSEPIGGTVTSDPTDFDGFTPMTADEQATWAQQYNAMQAAAVQGSVTPADDTRPCSWSKIASMEDSVRIGEMHVADVAGSQARWHYAVTADNEFSVGVGQDGTHWSASGTDTVSNSIGADSGFPRGGGYYLYVNGHEYFGKYHNTTGLTGVCHDLYMTHATSSAGDSYDGLNHPATNPWGECHSDPYGLVTIAHGGGTYDKDFSHAIHYGGVATVYGFTVGGRTGYTHNIHIGLQNNGTTNTYACGRGQMPGVPVLYNNPW